MASSCIFHFTGGMLTFCVVTFKNQKPDVVRREIYYFQTIAPKVNNIHLVSTAKVRHRFFFEASQWARILNS